MKVTPSQINDLKPNEIFVFGSNLKGLHAGGAARFAELRFGAEWGNGDGIQGNSYAIPSLDLPGGEKLPLDLIGKYVNKFVAFAKSHPELFFYVTPIGCGIAGFTESEIAPLFRGCMNMNNVALPESFINVLGGEKETDNENVMKINESQLRTIIRECIAEAFKSKKMDRLNREHGGVKYPYHTSKLTDDEIGGSEDDAYDFLDMNDGTRIPLHLNREHIKLWRDGDDESNRRWKEHNGTTPDEFVGNNGRYKWSNKHAENAVKSARPKKNGKLSMHPSYKEEYPDWGFKQMYYDGKNGVKGINHNLSDVETAKMEYKTKKMPKDKKAKYIRDNYPNNFKDIY